MKDMTLQEYVNTESAYLRAFEQYWKKKNNQNPNQWPLNLKHGDWDEQYLSFCESTIEIKQHESK